MSDYTPTTDEVRMAFGDIHCPDLDSPDHAHGCPADAMFDAWLAAHDAEVAAKAWDEGRESVALDLTRPADDAGMRTPSRNPYRLDGDQP